ncbi:MAG TPA: tetratricopeptide repeat protein [Verrucomicrobiae bacterium]|nr:tetratricopeptide repeat protein [Verrucomicrobiae bacterium]
MNRRFILLFFATACVVLLPFRSPAPLIYTPGEGWYYEFPGETADWMRQTAETQLQVAQDAFTNQNYTLALRAAHRVVSVWPLSDYAPHAQYLVGRCLEAKGKDEAAFNAYQTIIEKYPHSADYDDVLRRQYDIANRFLDGEWFRLWDTIPLYRSMDKTADLFSKIVQDGPYSKVAPSAQLRIGAAREKEGDYGSAVKAFATAADLYHDQPLIAADALFNEGLAWQRQAATAQYDQSAAAQAIAAYTDFETLYPNDPRVPEAEKAIVALNNVQVRGYFEIAQFYENSKTLTAQQRRDGAIVYYNEVLQLGPNSPYAAPSSKRLKALLPPATTASAN